MGLFGIFWVSGWSFCLVVEVWCLSHVVLRIFAVNKEFKQQLRPRAPWPLGCLCLCPSCLFSNPSLISGDPLMPAQLVPAAKAPLKTRQACGGKGCKTCATLPAALHVVPLCSTVCCTCCWLGKLVHHTLHSQSLFTKQKSGVEAMHLHVAE